MLKLLFNLLLIGAAAGIFFLPKYGISAKYNDIKNIQSEIKEYQNANDSAKKLAEKRDELSGTYNGFQDAQRARLVTFLPDNIDPIRFILEMEGIGKKLGMPIRGAKYNSIKNVANTSDTIAVGDIKYGEFTFDFSTEGSYDNLVKLLETLNNSLRLIDVTNITIVQSGGTAGVGDTIRPADYFTYNIHLVTYWLK